MNYLCIVGMHRSGTSVLTNALRHCGMDLGDPASLMQPKLDNPDGFFEHLGFVELNTDLLQAFGGDWDLPPQFPLGWEESPAIERLRARGDELLATSFGKAPHAVWKDPRNSLTLPFWRARGVPLKVIVCLRGPVTAARSLHRRGGQSLRFGLRLWTAYYRAIASAMDGIEVLVTHYDALRAFPDRELGRVLKFAQIGVTREQYSSATALIRKADLPSLPDDIGQLKELGALDVLKVYDGFRALAGDAYTELPEARDQPLRDGTPPAADPPARDSVQLELAELRIASSRHAEVERWLDAQLQSKLHALQRAPWPQDGLEIDFRLGGNAWRHALYGWAMPEQGGCWTDGHGAALAIPPLPKAGSEVRMRISVAPYMPTGLAAQKVHVRAGARELFAQELKAGTEIEFAAPRSLFPDNGPAVIHFDLPDATQPAAENASRDRRRLGILVTRFRMTLSDAAGNGTSK